MAVESTSHEEASKPSDWTVVTDEPVPPSSEVSDAATTEGEVQASSSSTRSRETRAALIHWQREQFAQRVELIKARAMALSHRHASPNTGGIK